MMKNDSLEFKFSQVSLTPEDCYDLVRRMELWPQLLRRQEEDLIASLVPFDPDWLDQQRESFLSGQSLSEVLHQRKWTEADLDLHLHRPEALHRFAMALFGPGLEDEFLRSDGGHDQIIYSLLRARDRGLVSELWIRLEEGEARFPDLAAAYGEGPEASRHGLIGPMPVGTLQPPELANLLRSLRPGELHPPFALGEWHVLIRLESLQPARFDAAMRRHLLTVQLDSFLEERVRLRLAGHVPDQLQYHT